MAPAASRHGWHCPQSVESVSTGAPNNDTESAGGGGGGSSVQSFWLKQPEPLVHVLPAAHSKGGLQVVPEASCGPKRV